VDLSSQVELGHFDPFEPRNWHGEWMSGLSAAVAAVPGAHVMSADPDEPHAVVAIGDPATAQHVLTIVPGVGQPGDVPGEIVHAAAVKAAMDAENEGSTAVVLWHGYTPPPSLEQALDKSRAVRAAPGLAAFQTRLRSQNPRAHLTVAGHSYGSVVAGEAARQGMRPDDLIALGSPGLTVHHASQLGDPAHVWAGANAQDPVARLGGILRPDFAGNPVRPGFGAQVFDASDPGATFPGLLHEQAHDSYWGSGSYALGNVAHIATGQYGRVGRAAAYTIQASSTLADQIELAGGWRDAWLHEERAPDGRWVRGLSEQVAGVKPDSGHVDIDQVWQSLGNLASDAHQLGADDIGYMITDAQNSLHGGTPSAYAEAARTLDQAQRLASGAQLDALAVGIGRQARLVRKADPGDSAASPGPAARKFLADKGAPALQKILGGDQHWNGKVQIVSRADWPFTYGEMTWQRGMRLREDIAAQIADDQAHPDARVHDPHSYEVVLHELIHGVGNDPAGKDMDAYQDERQAAIEEGFTELGATQHMAEWSDAVGIGDRKTAIADQFTADSKPTVRQLAESRASSRAFSGDEGPWGHYPWQTRAAEAWVNTIAHDEGLEGDAARMPRMVELADEINREGTYSKPLVMAEQVARTIDHLDRSKMTPDEWDSIIQNIIEGFSPEVSAASAGDPVAGAKHSAVVIAQKQMEREREAAA
jgi:Alpha/beta hydrolase